MLGQKYSSKCSIADHPDVSVAVHAIIIWGKNESGTVELLGDL